MLDHGYVRLVEWWGSDERIIESARMSTDGGFRGWIRQICCTVCGYTWECENHPAVCNHGDCYGKNSPTKEAHKGDARLLKYLYEHKHMTPFEMAGMVVEVQAPIFVFREWHRHRTQSYNELSARYTPLPDVNYLPTAERCLVVSASNKQAASAAGVPPLTHDRALEWLEDLGRVYEHAQAVYQKGLSYGLPKEVARLPVPVGRYSRMRASAVLRNWMAFLALRDDSAAQLEIQLYARQVLALARQVFPRSMELFEEGRGKR